MNKASKSKQYELITLFVKNEETNEVNVPEKEYAVLKEIAEKFDIPVSEFFKVKLRVPMRHEGKLMELRCAGHDALTSAYTFMYALFGGNIMFIGFYHYKPEKLELAPAFLKETDSIQNKISNRLIQVICKDVLINHALKKFTTNGNQ